MVVVPKPAVKGGRAFLACAVDSSVSPAAEQRADKALGLAVRLRPVRPRAAVTNRKPTAGERVHGGDIGRAVVGQDPLDPDPASPIKRDRPLQEAERGRRVLVRQRFRVREAAVVVNADVYVLVADVVTAL